MTINIDSKINDLCIGFDPSHCSIDISSPGYGVVFDGGAFTRKDIIVPGALQLVRDGTVVASVDAVYNLIDVPDEYHEDLFGIVPQPITLLLTTEK